jgi:hypothetical protein
MTLIMVANSDRPGTLDASATVMSAEAMDSRMSPEEPTESGALASHPALRLCPSPSEGSIRPLTIAPLARLAAAKQGVQ